MEKHNNRFAVDPERSGDLHRTLVGYNLNNILCKKDTRVVMNDFTISYNSRILQLQKHQPALVRPKVSVRVHEHLDSSLSLYVGRSQLQFTQIGISKKGKLSPVDYVKLHNDDLPQNMKESRMKPAGGTQNPEQLNVSSASKTGTNYFAEKRN